MEEQVTFSQVVYGTLVGVRVHLVKMNLLSELFSQEQLHDWLDDLKQGAEISRELYEYMYQRVTRLLPKRIDLPFIDHNFSCRSPHVQVLYRDLSQWYHEFLFSEEELTTFASANGFTSESCHAQAVLTGILMSYFGQGLVRDKRSAAVTQLLWHDFPALQVHISQDDQQMLKSHPLWFSKQIANTVVGFERQGLISVKQKKIILLQVKSMQGRLSTIPKPGSLFFCECLVYEPHIVIVDDHSQVYQAAPSLESAKAMLTRLKLKKGGSLTSTGLSTRSYARMMHQLQQMREIGTIKA